MELLNTTTSFKIIIIINIFLILCIIATFIFHRVKMYYLKRRFAHINELYNFIIDESKSETELDFKKEDIIRTTLYVGNIYLPKLQKLYTSQGYLKEDIDELYSRFPHKRIKAIRRLKFIKTQKAIIHFKEIITSERDAKVIQELISALMSMGYADKDSYVINHISKRKLSNHNEALLFSFYRRKRYTNEKLIGNTQSISIKLKQNNIPYVVNFLELIERIGGEIDISLAYDIFYHGTTQSKKIICNIITKNKDIYPDIYKLYQSDKNLNNYLQFIQGKNYV